MIRTIVLLLLGHLACSQTFVELHDIDYGGSGDTLQTLNIVVPETRNPPLLVWIGGGAWSYVDKNLEMDFARKLASNGIAVASIQHRLSPSTWRNPADSLGIQHPAHVEDLANAIRWLITNAKDYDYDPSRLFLGGFSSGAHLAALVYLDPGYFAAQQIDRGVVRGLIPISGAFDIVNYHEVMGAGSRPELATLHVEAVFGDDLTDLQDASVTNYLKHLDKPLLLIADNSISRYTQLLEDRLEEIGYPDYDVLYATEFSHSQLWRDISFSESSKYRRAVIDLILTKK